MKKQPAVKLRAFDDTPTCLKCGHTGKQKIRYRRAENPWKHRCECGKTMLSSGGHPEYLEVTCTSCGHDWRMQLADYAHGKAAQP